MAAPKWNPPVETSPQEERILKRLGRVRKLFAFLRIHRHEFFDDDFQEELCAMYRDSGAGRQPKAPAMLAMVVVLQAYMQVSDAEAVEMTVMDLRWQLVLDCLGATDPLFSQGTLQQFRERLIAHDLDRRLFERTIELAEKTGAFDPKALQHLRLAVDSAPFEGAGRVEDTINLLAHAARNAMSHCLFWLDLRMSELAMKLGVRLLTGSSVKAALDIDWSDQQARAAAVERVVEEVEQVVSFVKEHKLDAKDPGLARTLDTIARIREQDLEPEPPARIRRGVAKDRQISVEDPEMRHGRKSSSRRFDGCKRHLGIDLDSGFILYCGVGPANAPDFEVMEDVRETMEENYWKLGELHIDRGYLPAGFVGELYDDGAELLCRPWMGNRKGLFSKRDFAFDLENQTVTCPAGQTVRWEPGATARFDADTCDTCALRSKCTKAAPGKGRTLSMAPREHMHEHLRRRLDAAAGRARLRERIPVEHAQAHLVQRQGRRARYVGTRKNTFDVRRCAAVQNLERNHRYLAQQQQEEEARRAAA